MQEQEGLISILPPPEILTEGAARELFLAIRGSVRPELLRELKALYKAESRSGEAPAEIRALEARLQMIDKYVVSLLPRLGETASRIGWETRQLDFRNKEVEGVGRVTAIAPLLFSSENLDCVHGPYTVMPLITLAESILYDGEAVVEIPSISWTRPIRNELRLTVFDLETHSQPTPDCSLHGRFVTSMNRTLGFWGTELDQSPVLAQAGYNVLSQKLHAGQQLQISADRESVSLAFNPEGLAECARVAADSRAIAAAILLDLVPIVILNWKRGTPMLDCGYKHVPVPGRIDAALKPETRLEIRYRKEISHRSKNSDLWIAWYEFRYFPYQTAYSQMAMAEATTVEEMLMKLHS